MIQIKKTILTLVALLAVTTGAWADETLLLTIESKDNTTFTSGSKTFDDMVTVTFSNKVYNYGNGDGWNAGAASLLTVAGTNGYAVTSCKFYTENGPAMTGYTVEGESPSVYLYNSAVYTDASKSVYKGYAGITKIEVYGTAPAASAGPDIAWDEDKKTGTFTMPGGNVTVSVEYYDQATLAFQGLTAAEDAAAKTEAPLAVVADGAVTGGTLMYYVAPDKNFSQDDAIALAETEWSAAIPTAETVEAAGTCYVWYYIKGDAEHSDTDPKPLQVTVLPEPTYTVEFAEGTPETDKWKADPNTDVKKGQTVTVTYTGSKKVIGVKAEKKATTPSLSLTNPTVGQVIGSDGKNYAAASVPSGVTAVAMIAYVSGSNGLAIALADEGEMNWATAKSTCEAKTPAFTGGTWHLPTQAEWNQMFSANGGSEGSYTGLNTAITTAGGTVLQVPYGYWSSTPNGPQAYYVYLDANKTDWRKKPANFASPVRACLAF